MNSTLTDIMEKILGFERSFVDYSLDPLHGRIGLTSIEQQVINTIAFQRLKNIQQLGFVSNIYPGATHKRYEHCIGTLHITWAMFKQFLTNYTKQNYCNNNELIKFFTTDMLESLRLAALLHDLGHGPYSHSLEQAAENIGVKFNHDQLTTYLLTYDFPSNTIGRINSELIEINQMQDAVIEKYRSELKIIPKETREIIIGIYEKHYELEFSKPLGFEIIRYLLTDILKGHIGSDRIDYLLRDTYFSGLGHRFNFSDLLKNLRGLYDKQSNRLLLSIDVEGKNIVEFIMMTRYYHFRLIAHHLSNILEEIKFKERIKARTKMEPAFSFYATLMDDDGISRELPLFNQDIDFVGSKSLNSIGYDYLRYSFYRIASDPKLRGEYEKEIKTNIINGVKKYARVKLDYSDIFLAFVLEKAHLPIMQLLLHKYRIEKKQDIEKYSVLVHDHSLLLKGLARTYIGDSALLVFATKNVRESISKYIESTHHFFVNIPLFRKLLSNIKGINANRYDFLLFALYKLSSYGKKPIDGLFTLFHGIEKLEQKENTNFYDFKQKLFYDPSRGSFCYPNIKNKEQYLIDDLFLFDVSGLIELKMHLKTIYDGSKTFRSHSHYSIVPVTRGKTQTGLPYTVIPIRSALRLYPNDFIKSLHLPESQKKFF